MDKVYEYVDSLIKDDNSILEIVELCLSRFSNDFPDNDYVAWRSIVKSRKEYLVELKERESEDISVQPKEKCYIVDKKQLDKIEIVKEEYIKFLEREKPLSIRNYSSFKRIEETLSKIYNKEISIYSFCTVKEVEHIISILRNNAEFIEYNAVGKNQYSNALNWYLKFIQQRNSSVLITDLPFDKEQLDNCKLSSPLETVGDITLTLVKKMVEWDKDKRLLDDWKWNVMKDVVDGNKEFTDQMKYAFRLNLLALRKKGFPY